MIKTYKNAQPPLSGRVYSLTEENGLYKIEDATEYVETGSTFGANDIQGVCVIECTHSYASSVHTLTTGNLSAENLKFIATTDYNIGDTFKINGTTVTAVTSQGLSLSHKHFVTGSVVSCFYSISTNTLYFYPALSKEVKEIRCNATVSSSDKIGFNWKQEVPWTNAKSTDQVTVAITSGSYHLPLLAENSAGLVTLYFVVKPSTSVYATIVKEPTTNT